ncbi:N-acetylmuramic acid 6-phosphate etherase [Inhella gelatinilytica]|uniref:N-acetylmuramic acid 6-phosphate etherase n=1 Tax=Inhella gelatinilytica TaxID=2795030 RepID=A0A931NAM4_9BURK|nr:N-acetylmuramic acid 6-phosphate etherase [Inhella gelatinilytica]MBH9552633.1 N-acetylmuramic acid 6-phosphate etherase [Inhella gelatinilytica]
MLRTETPSPLHGALDTYAADKLVRTFVEDQYEAVRAVEAVADDLARAVDAAAPRLQAGGRLIYVGAGTSGRLGILDGVELLPTFSWPPERALGLIAGGPPALFKAVEGAEDDAEQGERDVQALAPTTNDVVIGVAASGGTPYVLGGLKAAQAAGALTLGLANNPGAPVAAAADIGIVLDTGPEVISGSTRLKAGTAQKIALNTLSSCLMVRLNKVHGNLMVDLQATNAKLRKRALSLTQRASGAPLEAAEAALAAAHGHVKLAVLMLGKQLNAADATALLAQHAGHLRAALDAP